MRRTVAFETVIKVGTSLYLIAVALQCRRIRIRRRRFQAVIRSGGGGAAVFRWRWRQFGRTSGGDGGGGGGSYVNPAYGESFSVVMHQRGTTSNPADSSPNTSLPQSDRCNSRQLAEAHKGTEVSVLKAGDWTCCTVRRQSGAILTGFPSSAWASNTAGTDLFFQGDGNLVIYRKCRSPGPPTPQRPSQRQGDATGAYRIGPSVHCRSGQQR